MAMIAILNEELPDGKIGGTSERKRRGRTGYASESTEKNAPGDFDSVEGKLFMI